MAADVVQSLWIGNRLSVMERLCIRSFLDHGHPFHLYCYGPIDGVPDGTDVRQAAEILPAEEIFVYRRGYGKGSPSAFSNYFRYKLLFERGGWWADLDACCTRPLDFADEHVLGLEREPDGSVHAAAGLVKAPAGSPVMAHCLEHCRRADKANLRWGQIGPRLLAEAVQARGASARLLEPPAFYPIDYWDFRRLVCDELLPDGCHSIHLWNSKWRHAQLDPDARYRPECVYEQLKRAHGVDSPPGARRVGGAEAGGRPHFVRRLARKIGRLFG